ncbi:MAG: crossover junction endodeoxyribonuclease RuvC [Gaiellaceae bacterium]
MRVIGIDPGTASCGFGVVNTDGSRVRAVEFGVWKTSARQPLQARLGILYDSLSELVSKHAPDAVAVEESYVGADPRVALSVGQARGALLAACAKADVAATEYPPATVKQAVGGWGRADKKQMQRMVEAVLGLDAPPTPHHAADALAVAICHALGSPLLTAAGASR